MHQNRKEISPAKTMKSNAELPIVHEPNEGIQINFAGTVLGKNRKDTNIIAPADFILLLKRERHKHDTDTTIQYLYFT